MIHLKDSFIIKDMILNFPILEKLQDGEYIIKYYSLIKNYHKKTTTSIYDFSSQYNCDKFIFILYITNYGRMIKSDIADFHIERQDLGSGCMGGHRGYYYDLCLNPIKNINANSLILYSKSSCVQYDQNNAWGNSKINTNNIKIELIEQPKLNYRIPKLFIDVIDAFHTQNTDLMQECCKKYLDITRESKIKDSIL